MEYEKKGRFEIIGKSGESQKAVVGLIVHPEGNHKGWISKNGNSDERYFPIREIGDADGLFLDKVQIMEPEKVITFPDLIAYAESRLRKQK